MGESQMRRSIRTLFVCLLVALIVYQPAFACRSCGGWGGRQASYNYGPVAYGGGCGGCGGCETVVYESGPSSCDSCGGCSSCGESTVSEGCSSCGGNAVVTES